ncbi:TonB-dependent receptor plug domain-containing protein [Kushneria aurantia]|uniref:TonB-dependent receptor plug domain-containing protein n=1 Tax=Kushneria aurantia TaxID=504092 RepID=A0ABV6G8B2_9GAMM|nr:TonB-dependent receptor [Kushneria aurantia]
MSSASHSASHVVSGALFLTLTAVGGEATAAQQTATAASDESLSTITVTGTPLPGSPLSQAAEVDVVDSDSMEAEGATNLGEALAPLAGVDSISTGNSVGKPVIRGLSGDRIRMLSDGMGVDSQQYGVRHMPTTDTFLLDRVEVVRGASSVLYGSSALGGAVNLLPREIAWDSPVEGEALTRYSSNNGQWDTGVKASGGDGRFGYAFGIIRRDAGNIETPDETTYFPPPPAPQHRDAPAYSGELDYTDFNQVNGDLAFGYRDDEGGEWTARYARFNDQHNFLLPPPAGQLPPPAGEEGVGQYIDNHQLELAGDKRVDGIRWQPKLMWQNNRRRSNAAGRPRSAGFDDAIDVEFDQYTARLTGQHGPVGFTDGGTLGVEYSDKDQVSRGGTQLSPGGTVSNFATFAFEERRFGDLLLQTGLRYDHHRIEGEASKTANPSTSVSNAESHSYDVVTGSLGGIYSFTDNLSLAGNVGRGFRAPGLFELYVAGQHGGVAAFQQGNPDLDPETSLNTDLSLRWASDTLRASATLYRNAIDDYIYPRDTGTSRGGLPVFAYDQTDALLTGVELSVEKDINRWLTLSAAAETVDGERRDNGDELPLLPADNLRLGARVTPDDRGGWLRDPYASLTLRHYASKDAAPGEPFSQFDGAPFGSASTDGYTLVDIGAGISPRFGNQVVHFDLAVHNLLDETYRGFLDTYKGYALSPGRDIRLTARLPFGG